MLEIKKIPGFTNLQLQIDEIRQNRTGVFKEKQNNCSVYFNQLPIVTENEVLDRTISSSWFMVVSDSQISLDGTFTTSRFTGNWDSPIKVELNLNPNFYLGNNLNYIFNQNDKSNNDNPVIFSFDENLSNPIKTSSENFFVYYIVDNVNVSYEKYNELDFFNQANTRLCYIIYSTSF